MPRLVLVAALLGACGSEVDDRPATLEFITETILAPSCAVAQCHSAFKRQVGDQFDTVDAARVTMVVNGLVVEADASAPASSYLVQSLTVGVTSLLDPADGLIRMPYDSPLPDADVELIKRWIADGIHGAQCVPNDERRGCETYIDVDGRFATRVVACVDGDIGEPITECPQSQICSYDTGNGQCVAQ